MEYRLQGGAPTKARLNRVLHALPIGFACGELLVGFLDICSFHSTEVAPMSHDHFIVPPGKKIRLKDYDPGFTSHYKNKDEASAKLRKDIKRLAKYQDVLYARNTYALLVMLQAMDTAGKDGTIRHVMSGVDPQGTQVHSFKAHSVEELDDDFLWRSMKALPERGRIGIFNRSYYEEVLIVRVHPEILNLQQLPPEAKGKSIWKHRFDEINDFEKYYTDPLALFS